MSAFHVVVVSPHRDDAAFSCAIALRHLAGRCRITIANFFTVSAYAPFAHAGNSAVSQLRLREDQAFADAASAGLRDLHLVDAPERLSISFSEIANTRALDHRDVEPMEQISAHLKMLKPELVLVPLALGDHIDHRIAQAAAVTSGFESLAFYEDLPYAARGAIAAPAQRVADLGLELNPWVFQAEDGDSWKARCAEFYPSQIGPETMREIAQYSERYGKGERFWVTKQAEKLLASY